MEEKYRGMRGNAVEKNSERTRGRENKTGEINPFREMK